VLKLVLRARDQMLGDFGLQNPCLGMRVCARSRAAGEQFMNQIIDTIEKEQQKSDVKAFSVGDGVRVHTRVVEGDKERIQIFAGVVIGRKGRGLNETFTVRRISYGEGVERVFPLHSPRIAKVEVEQRGRARRAKLNYLRGRKGKEATAVRE
jgi:large subunit ribosomal protein L19